MTFLSLQASKLGQEWDGDHAGLEPLAHCLPPPPLLQLLCLHAPHHPPGVKPKPPALNLNLSTFSADRGRGGRGQCSGGQYWKWVRRRPGRFLRNSQAVPNFQCLAFMGLAKCFYPAASIWTHQIHLWTGLPPFVPKNCLFSMKMRQKNTFPVTTIHTRNVIIVSVSFLLYFLNKWPTTVGEGMLRCYI